MIADLVPAARPRPVDRLLGVRVRVRERRGPARSAACSRSTRPGAGRSCERAARPDLVRDRRPRLAPPGPKRTVHRIDWVGAALLVGAVACVVLLTSWGGSREPWGSPLIVGARCGRDRARGTLVAPRATGAGTDPAAAGVPDLGGARDARLNLMVGLVFFAACTSSRRSSSSCDGVDVRRTPAST